MKNLLVILLLFLFPQTGIGQNVPDSLKNNQKVIIVFENSVQKKGYLIYDSDTEIKIWSEEIGFFRVQKEKVKRIEYVDDTQKSKKEFQDTDYSHHNALFNNGFSPAKGDVYIRAPLYTSACLDVGITDKLTLGIDAFYFVAMNVNLRYRFNLSEVTNLTFSTGVYYSYLGGGFNSNSALFSERAVLTIGDAEKNFSFGGVFLTNFQRVEIGVFTFSANIQTSIRNAFLVDIAVAPDLRTLDVDLNDFGVIFFGFRHWTKKRNRLDFGIANIFFQNYYYNYQGTYVKERFFVPIPYVQMAYKL